MKSTKAANRYVAFLRGINVGGHHKIPMADICKQLMEFGLENVVTILNSGNVIFDALTNNQESLEKAISENLENTYGFPVPTIIKTSESIYQLFNDAPFQDVKVTKDIRLYVSFLKKNTQSDLEIPWTSPDNSYTIMEIRDKIILSVLDISVSKTPAAMIALEKSFGTEITTRNWKTIEHIINKL